MILKVIFSVIAALLAGYGLITKNFEFHSYAMFFLSLMMLVMGLEEFRKERKVMGWISIVVFISTICNTSRLLHLKLINIFHNRALSLNNKESVFLHE